MKSIDPRKSELNIATWNIRTIPKSDTNVHFMKIFHQLSCMNIDIAFLQETRLTPERIHRCDKYTVRWSGHRDNRRTQGVAVVVKNELCESVDVLTHSERLMECRLLTSSGYIYFFNVYGYLENCERELLEKFYNELELVISKVPKSEQMYLVGDFNAHVGANNRKGPVCLGKYGVGMKNRNGGFLLDFCTRQNLCITNTYFNVKEKEKITFVGKSETQIDFVIARKSDMEYVQETRSYDSDLIRKISDHLPVVSKISLNNSRSMNQIENTLHFLCSFNTNGLNQAIRESTSCNITINRVVNSVNRDLKSFQKVLSKVGKFPKDFNCKLKKSRKMKFKLSF